MIQDVSNTLKFLLTKAPGIPPDLAAASIIFDRPVEPFSPTSTTVDLFLYDIRENLELRNFESTTTVKSGVATFLPPPLRVACSRNRAAWNALVFNPSKRTLISPAVSTTGGDRRFAL